VAARKAELAPNTRLDYRWRLDHVLRHLAHDTTAELDAHRVDTFRGELEAAGLSPRSVNMILDLLAQVLDDAVEYELLAANPARGKRPRMKVPKPARSFLEPDMVIDLLDVAEEWEQSSQHISATDAAPSSPRCARRPLRPTRCGAHSRACASSLAETSAG
jgi:site-specific recombinase XerC